MLYQQQWIRHPIHSWILLGEQSLDFSQLNLIESVNHCFLAQSNQSPCWLRIWGTEVTHVWVDIRLGNAELDKMARVEKVK